MTDYSASQNFGTNAGAAAYRLNLSVSTSQVSGGTQASITATATNLRNPGTLANSDSGSRSYSTPGGRVSSTSGTTVGSGSATWTYDFRGSTGQTVAVWSFSRFYATSYGSSASISVTAAGSGTSFMNSTTVSVNVGLFQNTNVTVPGIVGSTRSSANTAISNASLVASASSSNTPEPSLSEIVFSQSPSSGSSVPSGSTVFYNYYNYVAENYTVTYNANGGFVNPSSATVAYPNSVTLPTPSRTDYIFQGWYTSGGSYVGGGGNSYTPSASITLYAYWYPIQYTIYFVENGGTAVSDITANVNTTQSLPTNSSRSGFTFAGWYSNSALTVGPYSTWTVTQDQFLYAKWNALAPGFTDETISSSLLLNQDISSTADKSVSANNATGYSIAYSGSSLNPTSWLSIDNSGNVSGSTNQVGVYSFVINATGTGGTTPSNLKTITVIYPGSRLNATVTEANFSNAKRRDQFGNWISIVSMKRFDGTNWVDISN